MINTINLLLGVLVAGTPLVTIEVLSRNYNFNPEVTRKLTHALSAVAVILLTIFCTRYEIAVIAIFFFICMASVRHRKIWQSLYRIKRASWGEITFPLGVLAASLLTSEKREFVMVILLTGFADTTASLVGQKFGKPPLPIFHTKSYAGSSACLVSSFIIISLYTGQMSLLGFGLATAVTFTEAVSSYGLDNLTIPLAVIVYAAVFNLNYMM